MRSLKLSGLINLFALLHAAVAFAFFSLGINDELILTLLTITMIVLIGLRQGVTVEFIAAGVIVANIFGYLLGTGGAKLIAQIINFIPAVHALATLITTEILGWGMVGFIRLFRRGEEVERPALIRTPRIVMLLIAVVIIFMLRLVYIKLFTLTTFTADRFYHITDMLASNSVALIILLSINVIYIGYRRRRRDTGSTIYEAGRLLLFILLSSASISLMVAFRLPFEFNSDFTAIEFLQLWLITLLVEALIYSIIFMIDYAIASRAVLHAERDKTHQAQFRYMKLKQQVNPHFLFNSLNILDCLVCEERTEQASSYIHKLAGIYRYMLQHEEETLVRLHEEIAFVEMYVDLLQVRFPEGFEVESDISIEAMNRLVVPGTIQMLIENAIKHNTVGGETPLSIRIVAAEEMVSVCNNLIPKLSPVQSTGIGLNYIRQQYLDLSDKLIDINKTDTDYCVTLPLL